MFVKSTLDVYGKHLFQRVDSKHGSFSFLAAEGAETIGDSVECTEYVRDMVVFRTFRWIWCNGAIVESGGLRFGDCSTIIAPSL